ncbi:MAG: N-acetyltransferase [Rubrivivax sp.]|nr:N-acetyltransferase [Rubrivivax sp.]
MKPDIKIHHNPQAQRFEVQLGDGMALCSYRQQAQVLVLHHTEVPPALQGQGIAAALVQAALDWARADGLSVQPVCSYVAAYMQCHPQTQDLLA